VLWNKSSFFWREFIEEKGRSFLGGGTFGEQSRAFAMISWRGCSCSLWERGGAISSVSHPYKWNELLYIINNPFLLYQSSQIASLPSTLKLLP
jgi:hypothetical protein